MKRVIVDYSKLTNEILTLLVDKFPEGYDDSNVISFRNAKNELIEAVEVRTKDTIYLVKISTKLANRLENYDDIDIDSIVLPIDEISKEIDLDNSVSNEEDVEDTDLEKEEQNEDEEED